MIETAACAHAKHNATLRTRQEVDDATRGLRELGVLRHPRVREKNWDLHLAVRFMLDHVPRARPVLDAGGAISPILWQLEHLGYRDLWACDLRSHWFDRLYRFLTRSRIRFSVQDLTATDFPDAHFAAITCLSVIEHGVDLERYAAEMSRLLQPGGYLLTSTDYWCQPVDTAGVRPYGEALGDMKVFQPAEIADFAERAAQHGLTLMDDLDLDCGERVVHWRRVDRHFTFTFFVLRKDPAHGLRALVSSSPRS